MTHYLKQGNYYVAVEAADRHKPQQLGFWLCAVVLAFFLGAMAESTNLPAARAVGDSMARSDYADLVNSCYEKTRGQDADALYACIEGGN